MFIRPDEPDSPAVRVPEFYGQYGGADAEQLTAMIEVELGRDLAEQPVTFHSQRSGCCVMLGGLEVIGDSLQQAYFIAGKEGKQVFKADREAGKDHLATIGGTDFTPGGTVHHEHISRR
jgi:hypothetical protein